MCLNALRMGETQRSERTIEKEVVYARGARARCQAEAKSMGNPGALVSGFQSEKKR